MFVKRNISTFDELLENSWGGAKSVLKQVEEKNREDELMDLLEEIFPAYEDIPTETQINDFIWFDLEELEGWENLFD